MSTINKGKELMLTFAIANKLWQYKDNKLYNRKTGKPVGIANAGGYGKVKYNYCTFLAHRVVWLLHNKVWPSNQIDHIDRDKQNNSIENLRDVSARKNCANLTHGNKLCGVARCNRLGGWRARINIDGVEHASLEFKNWFEAACARKSMEVKYLGETL